MLSQSSKSYPFLDDSTLDGDIISRITRLGAGVRRTSHGFFTAFHRRMVQFFGTLWLHVSINVKITLIVVILTPLSLFVARFIAKNTFKLFHQQSVARGDMTSLVEEMTGNQKVVTAFGYQEEAEECLK